MSSGRLSMLTVLLACATASTTRAGDIRWEELSSVTGDLPAPGASTEQTAALVADLDRDGDNDFVIGFREKPPALVWYRREARGWSRVVIEPEYLTIEAGGAAGDIDRDGDLDLVFGADWQGAQVWWWENPGPGGYEGARPWVRRVVKDGGAKQHHDQVFADVLRTGRPQLAFWNQRAGTLFLANVPDDPRTSREWAYRPIHRAEKPAEGPPYVEGLSAADIDGDGRIDLLAGNGWLRASQEGAEPVFSFTPIASHGGRIVAGRFDEGAKVPQVAIAPGDGVGPLMLYRCEGDPTDARAWVGERLIERDLIHGHTLEVADVDADGHADILCAEMAEWTGPREEVDHPGATAWLLYGDGHGGFRTTWLARGNDFHEGRLADLDADGDLDVLNKPYTWSAPRIDVWLNGGTGARR